MPSKSKNKTSLLGRIHQNISRQVWFQSLILLGLRIYLLPLFLLPGWQQLNQFEETVMFVGDVMHFPYPYYGAMVAVAIQLIGGCFLLLGFLTRWSALLLAIVVSIIIFAVQWDNGWHYITEYNSMISQIIHLVQQHGNYDQLTQQGNIVILNNGVEMSTAYLLMLSILFVFGGGKLSLDAHLWDKTIK